MRRVALVLLAALVAAVAAEAYDLAYHEDITHRALARRGFTEDARRLVSNYNMAVDIKVNTLGLVSNYLREEHFDDRFQFSAHRALRDRLKGDLARLAGLDCDDDSDDVYTYAAAMGLIHHAFQDFYSHSNHTELTSLALEAAGLGYSFPTFDDVLQPQPGLDTLRGVWLADVPLQVDESLMSGAYFTTPPRIFDLQGVEQDFHHDILHKDQPQVGGDYLYAPDLDRRLMHFRSTYVATREMFDLDGELRRINGVCHAELRDYDFGILEAAWQALKRRLIQAAGLIFSHWRSGQREFDGDQLRVTITPPTTYPENPAVPATTWSYEVANLGIQPVQTVRLAAKESVRVADPLPAPAGWQARRVDGGVEWSASAGAEIAPGARLTFEVTPADTAVPGFVQLTTDEGRKAAQLVGPVAPDWFDASFLRAVALLAGLDEQQVLDDAGIPADRRRPPFMGAGAAPPEDRWSLWLTALVALVVGGLLGLLLARRRAP
ncbi:MAG: hypothetical protein R3325_06700 [Thermoanaerobaculia bacterium]|nr:hypothetical protein [Thermoanaerobaculia bacterium]